MKSTSQKVSKLLRYCRDHNVEIVSYGLQPNPNGFCYEIIAKKSRVNLDQLDAMFDGLNGDQEQELRHIVFGGSV